MTELLNDILIKTLRLCKKHPVRLCVESWHGLRRWTQHCATLSCVVCRVCVDVRSLRDLFCSCSATWSAASEKLSWTQLQAATPEASMTAAAAPRGVPLEMKAVLFCFFYTGITFGMNVASSLNLVVYTFLKRNLSCFFYVQPHYRSHA